MTAYRTIADLSLNGAVALVRADLNVPMKDGKVSDRTRLEAAAPTIRLLMEKGAKVVVMSHFGRPKGKCVPEMSLRPVMPALAEVLGLDVVFADDCIREKAAAAIKAASPRQVVMLENLRFHAGEEANDPAFARGLAALGDVYVNDAFSAAHRAHASTEGIAHLLPSAAGLSMIAEIEALSKALEAPERPVVAVVGGAKISSKLDVLGHVAGKVDHLIIGGAMANTFLFAEGVNVGKSLCEKDLAETAKSILLTAMEEGCRIHLPKDVVVAGELAEGAKTRTVAIQDVGNDEMMLDVGEKSVAVLAHVLEECRTLLWNGPLGAFEVKPFDAGTNALARKAAELTRAGKLLTVAGGGDTVAALNNAGVAGAFSHVSTAGGAFLEWLEGKSLPGVAVLEK